FLAESAAYLRQLCRRILQSACTCRGNVRLQDAFPQLQPAVHLRRNRHRQDASDARGGAKPPAEFQRPKRGLHFHGKIRERISCLLEEWADDAVSPSLSLSGRAPD